MIIVYIRHAPKQFKNGQSATYSLDPPLIPGAQLQITTLAQRLISSYGTPDVILSSPFLRTRQTAEIMSTMCDEKVPIHCDMTVSEYLGNHATRKLDVHPTTKQFNPPHPENFTDFRKRIKLHFTKLFTIDLPQNHPVIWVITHGIVIQQIAKYHKKLNVLPPKKRIEELTGLVLTKYWRKYC